MGRYGSVPVLKESPMRYLIASDIHGALPAAEMLVARFREEGADRLLLLGDLLYHGRVTPARGLRAGPGGEAAERAGRSHHGSAGQLRLRGGSDGAELPLPRRLCAGSGREDDAAAHPWASGFGGRRCGASCRIIVLSGHTHVKGIGPEAAPAFAKGIAAARGTSEEEGAGTFAAPAVTFVNPGSIGHPKDGSASYAIYEHGTVELHQL